MNKWLLNIDAEGELPFFINKSLEIKSHYINEKTFKKYDAILISNLPSSFEEIKKIWLEFSLTLGCYLPYSNSPIYSLKEDSLVEAHGLHIDGTSSNDPRKEPVFISFLVEKWPSIKNGGVFQLCHIPSLIKLLPKDIYSLLSEQKLQFYNYKASQYKANPPEYSFEIDCLYNKENEKLLKLWIPPDKKDWVSPKWRYYLKFSHTSFDESYEILSKIRKIAESLEVLSEINFKKNDILILKNSKVFHGRRRFKVPSQRSLHRIQLLNRLWETAGAPF